jgi:hypothetical protein
MGDGKTFEQALRALDKLIAEQLRADGAGPAELDPVRVAHERIAASTAAAESWAGEPRGYTPRVRGVA